MSTTAAVAPTVRAVVRCAILTGLVLSAPARAAAQDVAISGQVLDEVTGSPVSGAEVSLDDGGARVSTDSDGGFSITNLEPGAYTVHVVRLGYHHFTLERIEAGGTNFESL